MALSDQEMQDLMGAARPEDEATAPSTMAAQETAPSAQGISDDELKSLLASTGEAETSEPTSRQSTKSEALGKGAIEGAQHGIVSNIVDYATSLIPGKLSPSGEEALKESDPTGYQNYLELQAAGSPQERRDVLARQKQRVVDQYYSGVDSSNHPVLGAVGQIGGSLVDPTTMLAPQAKAATIWARMGQMGVFGAKLGAAQGASEGLATEGSVDPVHTAVTAGVGFLAAGALQGALVEPLSKLARATIARGRPVTPTEVAESLKSVPMSSEDLSKITPETIAQDLNDQMDMFGYTPEQVKDKAIADKILGETDKVTSDIDLDYKMAKADEFLTNPDQFEMFGKDKGSISEQMTKANERFDKIKEDLDQFDHPAPRALDDEVSQAMHQADTFAEEVSPQLKEEIISLKNQDPASMAAAIDKDILAFQTINNGDIPIDSPIGEKLSMAKLLGIDWDNPAPADMEEIAGNITKWWKLGRPRDPIESVNLAGETAVNMLDRYQVLKNRELGGKLVDFRKAINPLKLSKEEMSQVSKVMQKLLPEDQVSGNVSTAAKIIKNIFTDEVRQSVKQGIISRDEAVAMLQKGDHEGYWPHVYDRDALKSKFGKKAFINAISETKMSKDSAEIAVRSILGEKNLSKMSNYIRETGDGKYFIDPMITKMLWEKTSTVNASAKSSHLEMARKFPRELDEALQPFLMHDPELVVAHYLQDSTERLTSARVFGNNHEAAKDLFKDIAEDSIEAAKLWRETFLTEMRDPQSKAIQSFMDKPKILADGARILRALQVFKLTLSSITNLTQLPTNGLTYSMKFSGLSPQQRLTNYMYGQYKGFASALGDKAAAEEAQRAGASISSAMTEIFGRLNDPTNSLTGHRLVGPAEFINNPSVFLKYVGFNVAEEINRAGAYHMGKATVMSLLKNKAKYEALGTHVNPKKLEAVYKGLEELGISRERTVTVKDLENASSKIESWDKIMREEIMAGGQRFSNAVNFANQTQNLPLFAKSFYGKLLWQLRTFSYNQYHFVADNIIKPAVKDKNYLPAVAYLTAGMGIGIPLNEAKRFILADDSQLTNTEKFIQGQVSVAGFGLAQDFLRSATYGKQGVESFILGPGLTQAADLSQSLIGGNINSIAKGDGPTMEPFAKAVLRGVAFPGKKALMNQMKAEKEGFDAKMQRIIGGSKQTNPADKLDKIVN